MGKVSKMEAARRDGMAYALKIAKEQGIEGLEKELYFRNITHAPIGMEKETIDAFTERCKRAIFSSMTCLVLMILRDEWGFGKIRGDRFMEQFNNKAECLFRDFARWEDFRETIKEEMGIDVNLNMMTEDMSAGKRVEAGV